VKLKSRSILILSVLFGYILLQFISWEILFVRKTDEITDLKQKLIELSVSDPTRLQQEIDLLHSKKQKQVIMIVGEGTVFLLLLLFGIYKIKQAHTRELELTGQQKNFFLSITHELKTPIAATKLQLQTLQKHKLSEAQQNELIKNALKETDRLDTLINNVLFASRLESGLFEVHPQRQDVSLLTENVIQRYYRSRIENGELSLHVKPLIFADIDTDAYTSVLTNLIDNAFKYSFEKKEVNLSIEKKQEHVCVRIADQGTGITEIEKKKIFEKFFRAGSEETRRTKGTGLGLYIVNYLVKQHNGNIKVYDNKPRGSIFEINFRSVV
jgi:two-component system, OmpR family, sensor histidine kinase CiaH